MSRMAYNSLNDRKRNRISWLCRFKTYREFVPTRKLVASESSDQGKFIRVAQITNYNKRTKVKPSMPRMPWDN